MLCTIVWPTKEIKKDKLISLFLLNSKYQAYRKTLVGGSMRESVAVFNYRGSLIRARSEPYNVYVYVYVCVYMQMFHYQLIKYSKTFFHTYLPAYHSW